MKVLKKNKGFTLVELIVVIAIIGILAAVLIPSITGYIDRAHKSNDEKLAGSMTNAVQLYCVENAIDPNTLIGTDVRTILQFEGYDLIPRKSTWVFVYDIVQQNVQVVSLENGVLAAAVEQNPSDPTNIEVGRYLISKGETEVEQAVNLLCNLTDVSHYDNALSLTGASVYKSVVQSFNPKNTLYIKNSGVYTTALQTDTITRIVCNELTVNIPNKPVESTIELANNSLPAIIKTVESTSGIGANFKNAKVVSENDIGVIELDDFIAHSGDGYVYKVKLGAYVVNSTTQEFTDDIVNVKVTTFKRGVDGYKGFTVTRKFMVSYYNENGLYARGSMLYTTYSEHEASELGN